LDSHDKGDPIQRSLPWVRIFVRMEETADIISDNWQNYKKHHSYLYFLDDVKRVAFFEQQL